VEEYRDAGYLPHALVNYLALLGWGPEDGREVLTSDELVAEFDIARVISSSATFDPKKLEWMNGEHIRRLPLADLVADVLPFARARYGDQLDIRVFERAVALAQERATTLEQIAEQAAFLFVSDEDLAYDAKSLEKLDTTERANEVLDAVIAHVDNLARNHEWSERIELQEPIAALGLKPGKVMGLVYTAVQGSSSGIPLFESIGLLGPERTLRRLRAARSRLPGA